MASGWSRFLCTGALQFLSSTQTKIELQENQRSDQIIDALIHEVIFPPALADAWVLGDPDYSKLGQSTKLANLDAYSNYEEGILTVQTAGDNWVRQGGYSDQLKDTFDVYRGIRDITAAERGKFFFDREGKAVFWNRHHILDKDDVDATLDDAMTAMKYTFASLDQTKNEIIVTCHPRTIAAAPTYPVGAEERGDPGGGGRDARGLRQVQGREGQAHRRQGGDGRRCGVPAGQLRGRGRGQSQRRQSGLQERER